MMDAIFSIDTLWYLILCLYIPSCLGLIVIVLLQKGKGVGFAGAFGVGGGSDTVFGPNVSTWNLPDPATWICFPENLLKRQIRPWHQWNHNFC